MNCVPVISSEIEKTIKFYWRKKGKRTKSWLSSREFKEGKEESDDEEKRRLSERKITKKSKDKQRNKKKRK